MAAKKYLTQGEVRTMFSHMLAEKYGEEVPRYKKVVEIVEGINAEAAEHNPKLLKSLGISKHRLTEEKHCAIRYTEKELAHMNQMFRVMGMYPVGYYDLTEAKLPIDACAFRPVAREELADNPLRFFASKLRRDALISDEDYAQLQGDKKQAMDEALAAVDEAVEKRNLFGGRITELMGKSEKERGKAGVTKKGDRQSSGLTLEEAQAFVQEAWNILAWPEESMVTKEVYDSVKKVHGIAADILLGPHINHVTPVVANIMKGHQQMNDGGMHTIEYVQGPPNHMRKAPILLQQTSYTAMDDDITFVTNSGEKIKGKHNARFTEIESRGAALTPKGMELYDTIIKRVEGQAGKMSPAVYAEAYPAAFNKACEQFQELLSVKVGDASLGQALLNEMQEKASKLEPGEHKKKYPEILKAAFAKFPDQAKQVITEDGQTLQQYFTDRVVAIAEETYRNKYEAMLIEEFKAFPDGWDNLRKDGLAYFNYESTKKGREAKARGDTLPDDMEELIKLKYVKAIPITYEDFLPISAANIFRSNQQSSDAGQVDLEVKARRAVSKGNFEEVMGRDVIDPFALYAAEQSRSMEGAFQKLGVKISEQAKLVLKALKDRGDPDQVKIGRAA